MCSDLESHQLIHVNIQSFAASNTTSNVLLPCSFHNKLHIKITTNNVAAVVTQGVWLTSNPSISSSIQTLAAILGNFGA